MTDFVACLVPNFLVFLGTASYPQTALISILINKNYVTKTGATIRFEKIKYNVYKREDKQDTGYGWHKDEDIRVNTQKTQSSLNFQNGATRYTVLDYHRAFSMLEFILHRKLQINNDKPS